MGVADPESIRVVYVNEIPRPHHPLLSAACDSIGFLGRGTAGLAIGHAILLRKNYFNYRRLIAHDCVHVGQYERIGFIQSFLAQYLSEVVNLGYENSPLEMEAVQKSEQVPHVVLS